MNMNTLEEIERAISQLPPEELAAFRSWFAEFDAANNVQDIKEEEFETMVEQLTDEFVRSVGENAPLLSDYAISRAGIYEEHS